MPDFLGWNPTPQFSNGVNPSGYLTSLHLHFPIAKMRIKGEKCFSWAWRNNEKQFIKAQKGLAPGKQQIQNYAVSALIILPMLLTYYLHDNPIESLPSNSTAIQSQVQGIKGVHKPGKNISKVLTSI